MNNIAVVDNRTRNKIHPKKFALWISCVSIVMMFAAFSSAYVVRQAAGNWLEFRLPNMFFYSTAVMILSSITLHGSYLAFKKMNTLAYRGLLFITFCLGILFVACQYWGWQSMTEIGVELTTNPSGSFVYVLSGIHAAHVLCGIAILMVAMMHAFMLPHQVTNTRKLRFELTYTYWHFVDLLWIYLLLFFILQQ